MAEIGYIVFDGSQQIDTGLYTSGITETEVVFSDFSKAGQYGFVYGGYYDGGRAGGLFCIGSGYEAHVSLGNGEPAAISEDIRAGKITFKLKVDTTNNTGRYQWNDHTPIDFNWSGYYNKQPIQIAGMWRSSKEQMGAFKLYSFKAWQNGTLVRDMRPFRRDSDGTICLYDVVNEQAYLNIWSSQFPDVPSWRVDSSGALTNDEFIEAPEQAIAEPYPDALWRIDPSRNMGLPFCELMIGITEKIGAFMNAHNLENVYIPRTCTQIGRWAFTYTNLKKVRIPEDCEYYDTSFPSGCEVEFYGGGGDYGQLYDSEDYALVDADGARLYV